MMDDGQMDGWIYRFIDGGEIGRLIWLKYIDYF